MVLKKLVNLAVLCSALTFSEEIFAKEKNKAPIYDSCRIFGSVDFEDDFAIGMKAYVEYDGKKEDLGKPTFPGERYVTFSIPDEILLNTKELTVYAVDRNGAKSVPKKLYCIDGNMFEKIPKSDKNHGPTYDGCHLGMFVDFADDLSFGMRAYIEYDGKKVSLGRPESQYYSFAYFRIPEEVLTKVKEFSVYAVDRDGNKSKPRKLHCLEGRLYEEIPDGYKK